MFEKLANSYRSVMVLLDLIFNDFRNAYTRISDDYDIMPLVLFWFQLTIAVTAGNVLLLPATGTSEEFSKVWFVFGSILQFVSAALFAVFFHLFMKLSNYQGQFTKILKFTVAIAILFSSVNLVFSFLSDLYLYSVTNFFESMSSTHNPDEIIEYQIIDFVRTYVLNSVLVALVASLFYFSVYTSKTTLLCLALYAAIYGLVLQPHISSVWTSYMCKRVNMCAPVPMSPEDLEAFDRSILGSGSLGR